DIGDGFGWGVLKQIKAHPELRKLPVIILTTTEDPREVERCYVLGCNNYVQKPVSYDGFATAITKLGKFLSLLQIPRIEPEP
ncbi:MAG: response regulator, partial [Verrucomicrobiaceae bacterium]